MSGEQARHEGGDERRTLRLHVNSVGYPKRSPRNEWNRMSHSSPSKSLRREMKEVSQVSGFRVC